MSSFEGWCPVSHKARKSRKFDPLKPYQFLKLIYIQGPQYTKLWEGIGETHPDRESHG
jgi:hypothetical protein